MTRARRATALGAAGATGAVLLALVACTPTDGSERAADPSASAEPGRVQEAERVLQVSSPHEATGGTLLEGPAFGPDGELYLVDVMAPEGAGKVLRVDLDDGSVTEIVTAGSRAFTSAQFHPVDGRLYLTDIVGGEVVSTTAAGEDLRVEFTGEVDGMPMLPDDIAFDPDGAMFVSDTRGMDGPGWETPGRVVRIGTDGTASVLARDLPSPNGIVFDENDAGLWVAQYNANRIDYLALSPDRTTVVAAYPAIHVDGGRARVDSTAVDAAGNLYQAFHNKPEVAVYAATGELLETIRVPDDGLSSATNIAIKPGTTEGYLTVSGEAGGFVYSFEARGSGIRQSNGG